MAMVGWDIDNYLKIRQRTRGHTMLMLGNQAWGGDVIPLARQRDASILIKSCPGQTLFGVTSYETLDLDGGTICRDLESDLSDLDQRWHTVFNLGTLEHCWDAHLVYGQAARMVQLGGYYVGHAPCEGFKDHCVQITHWQAIERFFVINGFHVEESWLQDRQRGSVVHWIIARKLEHRTEFLRPKQIWSQGRDQGIG